MLDRDHAYHMSVCIGCYMTHATGEDEGHDPHDPEPLCLVPAGDDVTAGWIGDDATDPDADSLGFSWWGCDGCGSHLGGDRFKLTGWGARR